MYTLSLIFLSFHLFDLSTTCVAPQSMLWFVLIQWVALAFRTSPVAAALFKVIACFIVISNSARVFLFVADEARLKENSRRKRVPVKGEQAVPEMICPDCCAVPCPRGKEGYYYQCQLCTCNFFFDVLLLNKAKQAHMLTCKSSTSPNMRSCIVPYKKIMCTYILPL